jgi:hypothetical protein
MSNGRLSVVLLVAAILAAVMIQAGPAVGATVKCGGAKCGGTGVPPGPLPPGVTWPQPSPVDYLYEVLVMPGDHWHVFQVGTCDGDIRNYGGIYESSNWYAIGGAAGALVTNPIVIESHNHPQFPIPPTFTPHGLVSIGGPSGNCPYVVQWLIPPGDDSTAGTYYFGFDNVSEPHDVGATIYTSLIGFTWDENWSSAVGLGAGPVHGPVPEPVTLSLLALGALAALKRRRR